MPGAENRAYPKVSIPDPSRNDPSYHGIPRPVLSQAVPQRPPILRRASEDNLSRVSKDRTKPPLSYSAYYQAPQPTVIPSYPPPSPDYYRSTTTPQPLAARFAPSSSTDYFAPTVATRLLSSRFDSFPIQRPRSADGAKDELAQQATISPYDYGYLPAPDTPIRRRPSIRQGASRKEEDDFDSMPPPAVPRQRPSVSYDLPGSEGVRVEVANMGRRRTSYYDQAAEPVYDARVRSDRYQELAGPTVPLTAEALTRHQRRRDATYEHEYRRSATTRTTRAVAGDDENVTIKFVGTGKVMVSGVEINVGDSGEIEIVRQKSVRDGSERAQRGSDDGEEGMQIQRVEERRSRDDRLTRRARRSSLTHSDEGERRMTSGYI